MFRLTSLGLHLPALGVSAALHASLLLAAPTARVLPAVPGVEIEVDLAPDETPPAEPVAELPQPPREVPAAWTTHTHAYPVSASHDAVPHDPNLIHPHADDLDHDDHDHDHAPDEAPRFTMAAGSVVAQAHGAVGSAGAIGGSGSGPAGPASAVDDGPVDERTVDAPARLARGTAPRYPDGAREAQLEGDVRLELIVGPTGGVESVRVVGGLGHGLDEAAIQAARQFRFSPASKAGRPVRVRMGWSVQFRLR